MPDTGTKKKVTKVGNGSPSAAAAGETKPFVAAPESRKRAGTLRLLSILAWIVAIGFEVWAILALRKPPVSMLWLIVFIAADLAFAVAGSLMWKKANRLDPASEKDGFRFFMQNQLGAIVAIIAFLPLVVLIFTNKNLSGKQKGLVGTIAIIALVAAGLLGADFNPPSQEQYAEQTARVQDLTGDNLVYWTKSGERFHIYSDCYRINSDRTDEIFSGTVAQARELKNISQLCSTCEDRAEKDKAEAGNP